MKNFKNIPVWLQWFWKIWLGLIALLFLTRFVFLNGADENTRFFVFVPLLAFPWLVVIAVNMYLGIRLNSYLRKNHPTQRHIWGGFGPASTVKISFYFSRQDLGDKELLRMKQEYTAFLKLALTIFLTFPFLGIAMILGAKHS